MTETPQKIDDGGPAFPMEPGRIPGMSTRMWLAGMAADEDVIEFRQLVRVGWNGGMEYKYSRIEARYRYADAMLAAAQKEQPA